MKDNIKWVLCSIKSGCMVAKRNWKILAKIASVWILYYTIAWAFLQLGIYFYAGFILISLIILGLFYLGVAYGDDE